MKRSPILPSRLASVLVIGLCWTQAHTGFSFADDAAPDGAAEATASEETSEPAAPPSTPLPSALEVLQQAQEALVYHRTSVARRCMKL